jgi:hypothetical protein
MPTSVSAWACLGRDRGGATCGQVFSSEREARDHENMHSAADFELAAERVAEYCRNNDQPPAGVVQAMAAAMPTLIAVLDAAGVEH